MDKEAGHIVETAVEARAGFIDRPTTVVLIVHTSLTMDLSDLYWFLRWVSRFKVTALVGERVHRFRPHSPKSSQAVDLATLLDPGDGELVPA